TTYKEIFPQVYIFPVQYPNSGGQEKNYFQNFLLVALKTDQKPTFSSSDPELNKYLSHRFSVEFEQGIVLTDEYAPVEYFATKALH
ncbi:MAG: hypothetical protein JW731_12365, partial [Bacteroidales bacterium]|nr:hypothetical protein [Bacteroidales bacterium]